MNSIRWMVGGALVFGLMSGCIITTGETDSDAGGGGGTDATAGTTGGTGGTTVDGTVGTTGTGGGTGSSGDVPTTDGPTTGAQTTGTQTSTTSGGGGLCGWVGGEGFYGCGGEGEDPGGTPIACPPDLVQGDPCTNSGLTGAGCCDLDGNNYYCGDNEGEQVVVLDACGG